MLLNEHSKLPVQKEDAVPATRQARAHPARLGPARIGNCDRQDRKLSGRVDELLILGRALGDQEVRELFAAGNPYHSE